MCALTMIKLIRSKSPLYQDVLRPRSKTRSGSVSSTAAVSLFRSERSPKGMLLLC